MTKDNLDSIKHSQTHMMQTFHITNLGKAKCYLSVEISEMQQGIFFHHSGYINKLLDHFGMIDCTPLSTPMNSRTKLSKDMSSTPMDPKLYQSLVGTLLHATMIQLYDLIYNLL